MPPSSSTTVLIARTVSEIWTCEATCAHRLNASCRSWDTTCSIVVDTVTRQNEVPQELLLRFTAQASTRRLDKQSRSSDHRPEDFPVHQTCSQLSSPGQLPPRNNESSNDPRNSALPRRRRSPRAPITVALPTQCYHATA